MAQSPRSTTPVSKCIDLATYSARMLGKFHSNAVLVGLAARMEAAGEALDAAQSVYVNAVKAILLTRVDVKYEDHVSDQRIRALLMKAQLADGKRGGPIAAQLLPSGSSEIIRRLGRSQVQEMVNLEGRLSAVLPMWPDAAGELADITAHRATYAAALDGREQARQVARDLRAARNVQKELFVTTYTEIVSLVAAQFPRDKAAQDLFFDELKSRSVARSADEGDDEAEASADGGDAGGDEAEAGAEGVGAAEDEPA
jgi:hypothetical protein